jgi:hypothetical protein
VESSELPEIDASLPFHPQQLLWDELTVEPFVDFGKISIMNDWIPPLQLTTMDSDPY